MASHLRLTGCSLFACALLLNPIPAKTAPVLPLTATTVDIGGTKSSNFAVLSGADFDVDTFITGGFSFSPVPYGTNLGPVSVSFDTSKGNYLEFIESIQVGGFRQDAHFSGYASATSISPVFAPSSGGRMTVPATLQGSFTACLVPVGQGPSFPCDYSLPTYTLSFNLLGNMTLDFVDLRGQIDLPDITVTYPITPEPSSFALLFAGFLLLIIPFRYRTV